MPTATNRFEATLRDLEQAVVAIRRYSADPLDPNLLATACADAQRCLAVFGDVLEARSTSSLESFFSAVGAGVINAQRELDKHSIEYIQDTIQQHANGMSSALEKPADRGSGQIKGESVTEKPGDWNSLPMPPNAAMFRIPKVTAEFKFAVEQTLTKGINVIFYSNKVESQSLQQQTATIEVVSVPLPPNYRPPAPAPAPAPLARTLDAAVASVPVGGDSRPSADLRADKVGVVPASSAQTSPGQPAAASAQTATSPAAAKPAAAKKVVIFGGDDSEDGEDASQHGVMQALPVGAEPRAVPSRLSAPDPFVQVFQSHVLDEGSRADLFARIGPTIKAMGEAGFAHRRLLSRAVQARAIVLADEGHRYFILLGRGEPQPQLIVWQFSSSPAQLQQLLRLRADPQNPSGLGAACRFLERIGREAAAQRSRHGG
jgi:hypothetical protein